MTKNIKPFIYILTGLLLTSTVFSCLQPPDYPDEPVITFMNLNKNTLAQGNSPENSDTLTVTIAYTDGDGNLSNNNSEVDVRLIDSRDGEKTTFRLPSIPEQGTGNGISGEIYLHIYSSPFNLCCIFDDKNGQDPCTPSVEFPTDTFYYSITILDRDGNESNSIDTDPIILQCN